MGRTIAEWEEFAQKDGAISFEAWLRQRYVIERMSTLRIAQKIAMADPSMPQVTRVRIRQLLNGFGIRRRKATDLADRRRALADVSLDELKQLTPKEIAFQFGVHPTTARRARRRAIGLTGEPDPRDRSQGAGASGATTGTGTASAAGDAG